MTIIHIENKKRVLKTPKEKEKELKECQEEWRKNFITDYKLVPSKEPIYIVEMSAKEFQLVSFYLELEKRKPITNVDIEAKVGELL